MLRSLVVATPLFFATGLAAAAPSPRADAGKDCSWSQVQAVDGEGTARFRRLDQLPPANEQLTVIHSEDGCQKPVIVRYNIGGNPSAAR